MDLLGGHIYKKVHLHEKHLHKGLLKVPHLADLTGLVRDAARLAAQEPDRPAHPTFTKLIINTYKIMI